MYRRVAANRGTLINAITLFSYWNSGGITLTKFPYN